jgi:hypothetical protein
MHRSIIGSIAAAFVAASAQARDLAPAYWFENVAATDESTHQCLVFQTVKGVRYRVESSNDLSSWTTDTSLGADADIYGTSHQIVIPIREVVDPPPSAPGGPPATLTTRLVSLQLRRTTTAGGGTVATWPSLSGSGSVSILLAEEMCAEWHQAVRSCHYAGEYAILTWRFGADCPAPPPESSLGSEDLAFIPVLQAAFHGMNLEVKELQALARNSPPPAPADPGAKRFWRIKADWSVDSDADGSPDWAEFEMAEAPSHPFHLLADAFNGDVDNNQVPDGAQLDLDTDGTIDKVDTAPADPTYSQPAKPNRRYALFPVSPVNPPPSQKMAFQINDRGRFCLRMASGAEGCGASFATRASFPIAKHTESTIPVRS